jgi:hypothetical protein
VKLSRIDGSADLTDATIEAKGPTNVTESSNAEVILDKTSITSNRLNVTASNVSAANATISANNSGVKLSRIDGSADLTDASIKAKGPTKVTESSNAANAEVVAQDADITSKGLDIRAGKISAKSISVSTNSSGIDLMSESRSLRVPDSNLTTTSSGIIIDSEDKIAAKTIFIDSSGKIQFCAEKNINIADGSGDSKITTQGTADADFSSGNDVFTVKGVEITTNNNNNTMTYSPGGVTVDPAGDGTNSTESGEVVRTNARRSPLC